MSVSVSVTGSTVAWNGISVRRPRSGVMVTTARYSPVRASAAAPRFSLKERVTSLRTTGNSGSRIRGAQRQLTTEPGSSAPAVSVSRPRDATFTVTVFVTPFVPRTGEMATVTRPRSLTERMEKVMGLISFRETAATMLSRGEAPAGMVSGKTLSRGLVRNRAYPLSRSAGEGAHGIRSFFARAGAIRYRGRGHFTSGPGKVLHNSSRRRILRRSARTLPEPSVNLIAIRYVPSGMLYGSSRENGRAEVPGRSNSRLPAGPSRREREARARRLSWR